MHSFQKTGRALSKKTDKEGGSRNPMNIHRDCF